MRNTYSAGITQFSCQSLMLTPNVGDKYSVLSTSHCFVFNSQSDRYILEQYPTCPPE